MPTPDYPLITDYRRLFLDDVPLLDVRAPVEFAAGAFPQATNHPLLSDDERHKIGIRYKESGHDSAIELGRELLQGEPQAQRISSWKEYIRKHPEGMLYCFRGGMRSEISQQWIYQETGVLYPRVKGGYKALRNFLLQELQDSLELIQPLVIGGRTGVGKTIVLRQLLDKVDLEGLAWHRGSAFGRHATPQPTQIDFENALTIALMKKLAGNVSPIVMEDESKAIGSLHLPNDLYLKLKQSPMIILEASLEERIENSIHEYVHETLAEYVVEYGEEAGFSRWGEYALNSLDRIKKRLGGERHKLMRHILSQAMETQHRYGTTDLHEDWIRILLSEYYDPMYDYQIDNNKKRILFKGNAGEILDYLRNNNIQ